MKQKFLYMFIMITAVVIMFGTSCTSDDVSEIKKEDPIEEPKNEPVDEPVIEPNERFDISLSANTRAVADGLNNFYYPFAIESFKFVDKDPTFTDKNVVVSPLSASILLYMAANGVDDDDRKTLTDFLEVTDIDDVNSLASILLDQLPKVDNQTSMQLANSVWVEDYLKLSDYFTEQMESKYKASIYFENFSDDGLKDKINSWCSERTHGLITEMLKSNPVGMLALLYNAMYFKGKWETGTFDVKNSKKELFHGRNGDSEVDMMISCEDTRKYYDDENCQVVYLPFGNGAFSMMLVLPEEGMDYSQSLTLINKDNVFNYDKNANHELTTVSLPRFKVENMIPLDDILHNCGLTLTGHRRNFTMFSPAIETVILTRQAATLEIDEKGAEAAAITEGGVLTATPVEELPQPYEVKFDRPFYFMIREVSTGACLISGRIVDL